MNTTFTDLLYVTMGVQQKGENGWFQKKGGDEIEYDLGQMWGLVVVEVQQLGIIEV